MKNSKTHFEIFKEDSVRLVCDVELTFAFSVNSARMVNSMKLLSYDSYIHNNSTSENRGSHKHFSVGRKSHTNSTGPILHLL